MVLDNEQQRVLLLQVINSVPLSGSYPQVLEAIAQLDALAVAVQKRGNQTSELNQIP